MKKPFRFTIIDRKTKKFEETNITPSHVELFSYVAESGNSNISHLTQVKDVYEDTRYEAKLRLYNFVTYTKQGKQIPRYKPFEGTKIGKELPILNF